MTLFISSFNTRNALKLTIESLVRHTDYGSYCLWVVDNASTDGSYEYLIEQEGRLPLTVLQSAKPRLHGEWLDEVWSTVSTPYWVAVDSDMLFLAKDWLADLIGVMEKNPDLNLLAAERRAPARGFVEPVSHETIDLGEAPSTWLFCVRTSLRERIQSSFLFNVASVDPVTGRKQCYDTGGKLMADMRAAGLRSAYMPRWYTLKYHHFGSLSWWRPSTTPSAGSRFKDYQLRDINRRLRRISP